MPMFSECCRQGDDGPVDMFCCQVCGQTRCSGCQYGDRIDLTKITGFKGKGNVCAGCLKKVQDAEADASMSLYEYCQIESGGLTGAALDRYVNRYYGHN